MLALKLAPAIAKALLKRWLKGDLAGAATGTLVDALAERAKNLFAAQAGARTFEAIGGAIAEELQPLFESEGASLTEGDREDVARNLVARVEQANPISAITADPDRDAREYELRLLANRNEVTARFSATQTALYDRAVYEVSRRVVAVADKLPGFTEQSLVEVLRREDRLLQIARESLTVLRQIQVAAAGQSDAAARDYERRYRAAVQARLDWTELFGADLSEASKRQRLTAAYVTLTARRETAGDAEAGATVSVQEALAAGPRLLIRGDPGSGKTTLLKWIAVRSACGDFPESLADLRGSVPCFIRLREVASGLPAAGEFAKLTAPNAAEAPPPAWLAGRLESGTAFVLVDGVDEVAPEKRGEVHAWLAELVRTYPQARFVVSSRSVAVPPEWMAAEGFLPFELQPMSTPAVSDFIDQWHAAVVEAVPSETDRARVRPLADALKRRLGRQRTLRNLATNPLLCALLCALHRDREGSLPADRVEVYEACCNMLAFRRDLEHKVHVGEDLGLDLRRRRDVLEHLAYWMMRNNLSSVSRGQVAEAIWPRLRDMGMTFDEEGLAAVVRLLVERTCLLREPAAGEVDFAHLTLQEFLAAHAALNCRDEGFLLQQAGEDRWREVIVLASALGRRAVTARTDPAVSVGEWLVRELIRRGEARTRTRIRARCLLLSVACLEGAVSVSPGTREMVAEVLRSLVPPRTFAEADALASAGDLAVPHLAPMADRDEDTAAACARALVTVGTEESRAVLRLYRDDARPKVRAQWALGAETNPVDGAGMVWVPAGEFLMGSDDGRTHERPRHPVWLDGYWIYTAPVTVAQYSRFCQTAGRTMPEAPRWGWKDDHPVVNVSWEDARAYCEWAGMALPTEAQWEKAARGVDGRAYPWGDAWDPAKCANSAESARSGTVAVGSYPEGASPYGCLDMAGNVWEWCADWYGADYYRDAPVQNPTGPPSGGSRVVRGGSWYDGDADYFRCAYRYSYHPGLRDRNSGFRAARTGA